MAPSTQKQWTVQGKEGFDSLKLNEKASIPHVGENDVLVRFHAASLNYRDLIIPKGKYPFPLRDGVVPGSDGAGVVEQVGSKVSLFKNGDKVVTLFNQGHLAGPINQRSVATGVGGVIDGVLQQYGVFSENGLVAAPQNLSFVEAATLSCAGLTAWNSLYGLKPLQPGDWVLTQGTGGVSIFAVQFAKAAGARVIATTSSADKAARLKELGADHVINYREDKEWGKKAKELTGGAGVDYILEVGGPNTMRNSLAAVKFEGIVSIIGFLGGFDTGSDKQPTMLDALTNICTVRGILVGSRAQLEQMVAAIEANDIHPVVDKEVFKLEKLREAYEHQDAQKHFGKVCVEID